MLAGLLCRHCCLFRRRLGSILQSHVLLLMHPRLSCLTGCQLLLRTHYVKRANKLTALSTLTALHVDNCSFTLSLQAHIPQSHKGENDTSHRVAQIETDNSVAVAECLARHASTVSSCARAAAASLADSVSTLACKSSARCADRR